MVGIHLLVVSADGGVHYWKMSTLGVSTCGRCLLMGGYHLLELVTNGRFPCNWDKL